MGNLASITMCSHFFLLMVVIYRKIQILLPSLGTFVDGDPRERVDSFMFPLDPLCAHLRSQGGFGGFPWAASSGGSFPEVCQVVSDGDFLHSQDRVAF